MSNEIKALRKLAPIGSTVYTTLEHVSRSGMSRRLRLFVVKDNKIVNITYRAARIMGDRVNDDGTITVGGTGMDMGFSTVYDLSMQLYRGSRSKKIERGREGYALNHQWIM